MADAETFENLNPSEQVAYLRDEKGTTFELVPESVAEWILAHESCFYRLKAYAKNFDKYQEKDSRKGRYVGVDFGMLVELDALDGELRDLVLELTLDVEEALKVRINRAAMACGADPCELTEAYLAADHDAVLADQVSKFDEEAARKGIAEAAAALADADLQDPEAAMSAVNRAMAALGEVAARPDPPHPDHVAKTIAALSSSTYSGGIVRRHENGGLPYWCLLELVSLGPLIGFYKQCFKKVGLLESSEEQALCREYKNMLRQAQGLRNAAAHNCAMLNTLSKYRSYSYLKGSRRKLRERGIDGDWVDAVASVPLAMELGAVLMCHEAFVERPQAKALAKARLLEVSERFRKNAGWFSKCYPVASFIEYASRLFSAYADRY